MLNFNFRHLSFFCAVVEEKSISKAAHKCSVSQPALSMAISNLENLLDGKLLDRTPEGIVPTSLGHSLHELASNVQFDITEGLRKIEALKDINKGQLNIGISPSVSHRIVGNLVRQMRDLYPKLLINVVHGYFNELQEQLLTRQIDMMLSSLQYSVNANLNHNHIYSDELVAVCSTKHPLSQKQNISNRDLEESFWVFGKAQLTLFPEFFEHQLINTLNEKRNFLFTDAPLLIREMILRENFFGFVPSAFFESELLEGTIKKIPIENLKLELPVHIFTPKNHSMSPASEVFIELLKTTKEH